MNNFIFSIVFLFASGLLFASDLDGVWNFVFIHEGDAHSEVVYFEGRWIISLGNMVGR